MSLLGQLLLTKAVEHMELLGQDVILLVAARSKLHLQNSMANSIAELVGTNTHTVGITTVHMLG